MEFLQIELPEQTTLPDAEREERLLKTWRNEFKNGGMKKLLERRKIYENLLADKQIQTERPGLLPFYQFGLRILNQVIMELEQ